jgi:hypothetical protein
MGAVGRQLPRLWCREQGSALSDVTVEGRDEDCVVGKGASLLWGVNVVIGTVTIVGGRSTAGTGSEGDDDVRGVGVQLSGGRHRAV